MSATLQSVATEGWWGGGVLIPVPTAPILSLVVSSDIEILLDWTSGEYPEYYKLKRKKTDGGTYEYIGGDDNHRFYNINSYVDTNLDPDTSYTYAIEIYNVSGNATSIEKTISTLATASVPLSNAQSELLISIKAAILEIEDSVGAPVFNSEDIVIGEFATADKDEDGNDQKDLINKGPEDFPCVEISPQQRGGGGEGYESQRQIKGIYGVRIALHTYEVAPGRVTGADIKTLSLLGSAVLRQMFRFTDKASGGNPPCPGFLMTEPTFTSFPAYELVSQNVNTEIIDVSFRVDANDTEL